MSKLAQRSDLWFKLNNGQPVDLTVTMEGTGSATAKLYRNKIIIECAAAQVDKYVNVSTPLAFEVLDCHTIHDNATASSVQLKNTAGVITAAIAIAASDKDIDKAVSIDDAYSTFARGDDDLRAAIATGAFTGKIVIKIEPIVQ